LKTRFLRERRISRDGQTKEEGKKEKKERKVLFFSVDVYRSLGLRQLCCMQLNRLIMLLGLFRLLWSSLPTVMLGGKYDRNAEDAISSK